MSDRGPGMSTAWAVVWLVLAATIVLYFFTQLLSQIWGWLLGLGILGLGVTGIVIWLRRRNRW